MRRTAAFITHELRTQGRSLRFRVAAAVYLIAGSVPAVLAYLHRSSDFFIFGGATYAKETMYVLPLLTEVLAILLSLDGISRERTGGAWTTLGLTDLTNAGYLLRRWLALQVVVVPLTAVPLLVAAGLAVAAGAQGTEPAVFWGPWLLQILPLAVLGTTLGLGLGTIGGGGMGLFATAALVLVALPWLANSAVAPLGYRFRSPLDWLDTRFASMSARRIGTALSPQAREVWYGMFPAPATEAGYDLGTVAEQSLADGLVVAAVAAAVLGLGISRLRRTRPDLRPWTVRPDHPLRSFLQLFGRLRESFLPDPALHPVDRAGLACALLLAATAGGALLARADRYDDDAWRMVRAETSPPEPTPRDVLPGLWQVEGTVAPDGKVALRIAGSMRNTGRVPYRHLAFSLNPDLDLLGAAADVGTVHPARRWDRLTVDVDPPLAPGERRELRFRLGGRPDRTVFPERPKPERLVDDAFGSHQRTRFARDLIDFSPSYRVPSVSGYRVELQGQDLLPVPRYGPWTLTSTYGIPEIADETIFPQAEVRLALSVPPGLFLADSCGDVAHGGRLESRCALPLPELTVAGGRHQALAGSDAASAAGAVVAVFPAHHAAGELHLGFLARSSRMLGEAWPGLGGLAGTVVLEWPDEDIHGRNTSFWFFSAYEERRFVRVRGRLIFLDEARMIGQRPIAPESLVAEVVSSRLAQRRRLDPDQQLFFLELFRKLALQRLGLGPESGAVVAVDPKYLSMVLVPALGREEYSMYWSLRFPALVAALEHRAGREPLRAAVDELLAGPSRRPATFDEFAAILRRHAQLPVDGMIRDFFRAGRMPQLVLEDVAFHRAGAGWRATGQVRNQADGEAVCRVVLAAAVTPVETTVTVETGGVVPFSLETPNRPQAVYLDPDHECHRMLPPGAPRDVVFFEGERP